MRTNEAFAPDWASPPGETIQTVLRERAMTSAQLASGMGRSHERLLPLLEGREPITLAVARQLAALLGASVAFWMARDSHFRRNSEGSSEARNWLSELPLKDMIRFGWLAPSPRPAEEVAACLAFFGVRNVAEWRSRYANLQAELDFHASKAYPTFPGAVAAWVRQGERLAEICDCKPWSPVGLRESMSEVRRLTRLKSPSEFVPELQSICASVGVAVCVVRAPEGCRASGATRLLSDTRALIQLSFRYLSDDQFWFTFFHECGHLLLHGPRQPILETDHQPETERELEASSFAGAILIPPSPQERLAAVQLSTRAILRLAKDLGISPGLVVGQLQHLRRVPPNKFNGLKRRFGWND